MTSDLGGFAPKYHRVADQIRRLIRNGMYGPGDQMPTEASLADRFRVSLPTVRQAIAVLRAEGLLESRQGVGTFVKSEQRLQRRSRHRYGRARADKQLLTSHLRHQIVFAGRAPVPDAIAGPIGLDQGAEVVVRRRILFDPQTGRPEEVGASYIPVDIAGGSYLEEPVVVPKALFLCIEELSGKTYHYAHDQWVARAATSEEASALELPSRAQVVHLTHVAEASDGTVLEVSESVWPAERITVIDEYPIAQDSEEPHAVSDI
jgi:GntR family transcriptional regulator